jgi:hypothetical protein
MLNRSNQDVGLPIIAQKLRFSLFKELSAFQQKATEETKDRLARDLPFASDSA